MLKVIRQAEFVEGPWRNGRGVSWEIAALREPGASDFSWRFAKARIDGDVPFSVYPGMDRVFMQISGDGLDLEFGDGRVLAVHESFVPHQFSCDAPLTCKLRGGACFDLNLFVARGVFAADAHVMAGAGELVVSGHDAVVFALQGQCDMAADGARAHLAEGDAAVVSAQTLAFSGENARVFAGILRRV